MYYYISGVLVATETGAAVIDNHGIAYRMTASATTLARLSSKMNENVRLFTYLHVYQDGLELFGFFNQEELSAFRLLIAVSGVGPKAAMAILSQMTAEQLSVAVATGDAKAIARAPGVGQKTAARIILELKDKLAGQIGSDAQDSGGVPDAGASSALSEALNALMVLGYSRAQSAAALRGMDPGLTVEQMIPLALKKLS